MKFLLQRVSHAAITLPETATTDQMDKGYIVYVGISTQDLEEDRRTKVATFVRRVVKFKLFSDATTKKDLSLADIGGSLLIVSNFTLYGRNKKGSSIDFCHAAPYAAAEEVYTYLVEQVKQADIPYITGKFGALMQITSTNDGPINCVFEY